MISFKPGNIFPDVRVKTRDGKETSLIPRLTDVSSETDTATWYAIFIYRGKHCPICAKYLNQLQDQLAEFNKINTKVIAVSADSVEQLNEFYSNKIADVKFPVYAGLSIDVMQSMELFMSSPRSSAETDHVFAEPGLFVVNSKREIQMVDKANGPFVRTEIEQLLSGIEYTQQNDYPIRGNYTN